MNTSGTIEDAPKTAEMHHASLKPDTDASHIENMHYPGSDKPDQMDYGRVDSEVAKYTSEIAIDISDDENKRLKKLIDKRVLIIMIVTYFIQALDKGTLAFTSIMGIKEETHLVGNQVFDQNFYTIQLFAKTGAVFLAHNMYIPRHSGRGISHQLAHPTRTNC